MTVVEHCKAQTQRWSSLAAACLAWGPEAVQGSL